jgi:hypothetical protein
MESITTANQTNKEIEEFIEGDYITIKDGESRVLELYIVSDDGNDILHTLQESEPKQVTCNSCYYCDYTTYQIYSP